MDVPKEKYYSLSSDSYSCKNKKSVSKDHKNYLGCSVRRHEIAINFLWKNKSSLLLDENREMIKLREILPETVRGFNVFENLCAWKRVNPDCTVNLWVDSNDSNSEKTREAQKNLAAFDVRVYNLRDSSFYKMSSVRKYFVDGEELAFDNVFDHFIQCGMDWEVIDLLKILTLLDTFLCGFETSIFSDLDIVPFSVAGRLSGTSYGHNHKVLLEVYGFLIASTLISNGNVLPANNFFVFTRFGLDKLTTWFDNAIKLALEGHGNAFRCMEDSLVSLECKKLYASYSVINQKVLSRIPLINIGELQGQRK